MKSIFIFVSVLFLIGVSPFCLFSQGLKVGYVNTIEVFNEYQRTKDQDELLEEEKDRIKEILETKENQIREIQGSLEMLREGEREREIERLQSKMESYRQLRQKELSEVQEKRDEMMREIVEDIDQTIKDYARENGYDLILNGNSVLYAPEGKNLSSDILRIINRAYRRRR